MRRARTRADLPTPPEPSTTNLYSRIFQKMKKSRKRSRVDGEISMKKRKKMAVAQKKIFGAKQSSNRFFLAQGRLALSISAL